MELRDLQLTELHMAKLIADICQKNGWHCYLTAGTLLGAVRHQGFIPWDDDIDLVMFRTEFDQLSQFLRDHPLDGYFYQDAVSDPDYPFLFGKLRKCGTEVQEPALKEISMHKGIYIDIFPLDICPDSRLGGTLYFKWVEQLETAIMLKVNPAASCGYTKWYMRFLNHLLCQLSHGQLITLWKWGRWMLKRFCSGRTLCTVCGSHGYPRETYSAEWFQNSVCVEFENTKFPAPIGWDHLLHNMYGTYMDPPPLEERNGHF